MATRRRKISIGLIILIVGLIITFLDFVGFERVAHFFKEVKNVVREDFPAWYMLILFSIFLIVLLLLQIRKKYKPMEVSSFVLSYPRYGYKDIGYEDWDGVKWLLRYPNPSPTSGLFYSESVSEKISQLNVKGPFCPKCKTELSQGQRFFHGFVWVCNNCEFKVKKRYNIYKGQEKALKVFQGKFRKTINNRKA